MNSNSRQLETSLSEPVFITIYTLTESFDFESPAGYTCGLSDIQWELGTASVKTVFTTTLGYHETAGLFRKYAQLLPKIRRIGRRQGRALRYAVLVEVLSDSLPHSPSR